MRQFATAVTFVIVFGIPGVRADAQHTLDRDSNSALLAMQPANDVTSEDSVEILPPPFVPQAPMLELEPPAPPEPEPAPRTEVYRYPSPPATAVPPATTVPPTYDFYGGKPVWATAKPVKIRYMNHRLLRRKDRSGLPPQQIVLMASDPLAVGLSCYPVQIPVCVPGACFGKPVATAYKDFLGRGVVAYDWCCGFRVKIVFRCSGDIVVHYYG